METINIAYYILDHTLIQLILKKTPYEFLNGRKSNISYFHVSNCRCFILNNGRDKIENFDTKFNEDNFLDNLHLAKYIKFLIKKLCSLQQK